MKIGEDSESKGGKKGRQGGEERSGGRDEKVDKPTEGLFWYRQGEKMSTWEHIEGQHKTGSGAGVAAKIGGCSTSTIVPEMTTQSRGREKGGQEQLMAQEWDPI